MPRYSAIETDGGYPFWKEREGKNDRLFIDWTEINLENVILIDEERGYIDCAALDINGDVFVIQDEIASYRLHGPVKLFLDGEHSQKDIDDWNSKNLGILKYKDGKKTWRNGQVVIDASEPIVLT